jgi:hypothetical protein
MQHPIQTARIGPSNQHNNYDKDDQGEHIRECRKGTVAIEKISIDRRFITRRDMPEVGKPSETYE